MASTSPHFNSPNVSWPKQAIHDPTIVDGEREVLARGDLLDTYWGWNELPYRCAFLSILNLEGIQLSSSGRHLTLDSQSVADMSTQNSHTWIQPLYSPLLNWAELDTTSLMLATGFLRQTKGIDGRVPVQDVSWSPGSLQPWAGSHSLPILATLQHLSLPSDLALTSPFWIRKKCYFSPLKGCWEKYGEIWSAGHRST